MTTDFRGTNSIIHIDYYKKSNQKWIHANSFERFNEGTKEERPNLIRKNILLHKDSAEVLPHPPYYRMTISKLERMVLFSGVYFLFPNLKRSYQTSAVLARIAVNYSTKSLCSVNMGHSSSSYGSSEDPASSPKSSCGQGENMGSWIPKWHNSWQDMAFKGHNYIGSG